MGSGFQPDTDGEWVPTRHVFRLNLTLSFQQVLAALVHEPRDGGCGGGGPTQLHDPGTGQAVRDPSQLAQNIANFWQDISALPSEV